MGDEPSKIDASGPAPTSRKRELPDADDYDGDLKRVAEIVMVLEVLGRMRGGSDPTAVEKGLAAEARTKLVTMCESFRPNDLFTSDAARILAADLGFNPAKDQIGNRPARKQLSISEKITITKKKMEESREFKVQTSPYPPPHPVVGAGIKPDHRPAATSSGPHTHRISSDKQSQTPMPIGSFQQGSPAVLAPNPSFKTLPLNDVHKSLSTVKPAGGPAEAPHFRVDSRPGALPYPMQVQGNHSASFQSTVAKPSQAVNVVDRGAAKVQAAHSVNPYQTSSLVVKDQGTVGPAVVVVQGNIQNTAQQLQPAAIVASNDEIAMLINRLLQPKPSDLSSWNPPSLNYMNKPLPCQVCKINITDAESLFVCDACEKGTHLGCLKLLSQRAASNVEWYCPSCLQSSSGKPFPPKYGRVTRSHSATKPSNTSGVPTVPEKTTGSSNPKVSHQNTVPNISASTSKPSTLVPEKMTGSSNSTVSHQNRAPNVHGSCSKPATFVPEKISGSSNPNVSLQNTAPNVNELSSKPAILVSEKTAGYSDPKVSCQNTVPDVSDPCLKAATIVAEKTTESSDPNGKDQSTVLTANDPCSKPATLTVTSSRTEPTQPVENTNAMDEESKTALADHTNEKAEIMTGTNQADDEAGSSDSQRIPNETSSQDSLMADANFIDPASSLTAGDDTKTQSDPVVYPDASQQSHCPPLTQDTEGASGPAGSDD